MATLRSEIEDKDDKKLSAMKARLKAAAIKRRKAAKKKREQEAKARDKKAAANVDTFKGTRKNPEMAPSEDPNVGKRRKTKGRFGVGSNKTLNGKANVSAEQLKKTGLGLTAYMNQWNKTGKRPTAASQEPAPPPRKVGGTKTKPSVDEFKKFGKKADSGKPKVDSKVKQLEGAKREQPESRPKKQTENGRKKTEVKQLKDAKPMKRQSGEGTGKASKYKHYGKKGSLLGDFSRFLELKYDTDPEGSLPHEKASGGMIGQSDMSAKKTSTPKKKKMPQYYMGGGPIKKGKKYANGGRVAKYRG